MAAMAGALGVTLEKPGAYRLGAGPLPDAEAIDRACRVLAVAVVVSTAAMVAGAVFLGHFFFVGPWEGWVS
jgi:cobalamin biosynthesis protein CobD/CbiB